MSVDRKIFEILTKVDNVKLFVDMLDNIRNYFDVSPLEALEDEFDTVNIDAKFRDYHSTEGYNVLGGICPGESSRDEVHGDYEHYSPEVAFRARRDMPTRDGAAHLRWRMPNDYLYVVKFFKYDNYKEFNNFSGIVVERMPDTPGTYFRRFLRQIRLNLKGEGVKWEEQEG